MRTIKFRGLIPTSPRKWVYGGYWYTDIKYLDKATKKMGIGPHHCILPEVFDGDSGNARAGFYGVIPETVGQFTGLLDHNGKEIFEADILKNAEGHVGVIKYGGWAFGLCGITPYANERVEFSYDTVTNSKLIIFSGYRVIGNIHENPELIN